MEEDMRLSEMGVHTEHLDVGKDYSKYNYYS